MNNLFDDMYAFMEEAKRTFSGQACKFPYNAYEDEDGSTVFEFALAGFDKEWLKVEKDRYQVRVTAMPPKDARQYLVKGISTKPFNIAIPRYHKELKEVTFLDGILKIRLVDTTHETQEVEILENVSETTD